MKGKILYLLLLLATLWAAVTSDSEFPRFLFVFEILFAVFMGIWVHQMAKKIKAELVLPRSSVIRGEKAPVRLYFQNPTIFPVGDIRITAEITGGGQIVRHTGVAPKSRDQWQLQIQPVHCGETRIVITELRIFDYIGLFSARMHSSGKKTAAFGATITVLPRITPYSFEKLPSFVNEREQNQETVLDRSGTDSQEIFDTRYYRQGDMLKNIHWKLSAKADDILVKEFSMPAELAVEVYLDMAADADWEAPVSGQNVPSKRHSAGKKAASPKKSVSKPGSAIRPAAQSSPESLDAFWDLAASAGNALAEHKIPFVYIISLKKGEPFQVQVPSLDKLYPALEEVVGITPEDCEALPSIQKGSSLRITLDGEVREN